jgi:hypothetical protein
MGTGRYLAHVSRVHQKAGVAATAVMPAIFQIRIRRQIIPVGAQRIQRVQTALGQLANSLTAQNSIAFVVQGIHNGVGWRGQREKQGLAHHPRLPACHPCNP